MIKLTELDANTAIDSPIFQTGIPGYLFEVSGIAELACRNGFDFLEDDTGVVYSITVVDETAPDLDETPCACDEHTEPSKSIRKDIAGLMAIDDVIHNSLMRTDDLTLERAHTIKTLADTKAVLSNCIGRY